MTIALKSCSGPDFHTCDTLEKAIEVLEELGLCMNWAHLTSRASKECVYLLYEAWIYRRSHERFVELPFSPESHEFALHLKLLLHAIFDPFLLRGAVHRSFIHIVPHSSEANCFFVNLFLVFGGGEETKQVIATTLGKVEDGHDEASGTFFWLD